MPIKNRADPPRGDPDIDRMVHAADLLLHSSMICVTAVLRFLAAIAYSVGGWLWICLQRIRGG